MSSSCCVKKTKSCPPKQPLCKLVRICREPSKVKVMEVKCPKKDKIVCTKVKST